MMAVTIEKEKKIRLLSDEKLYRDAVKLATSHASSKISNNQLSGLWNAVGAGDWNEIVEYINNRLERKTTSGELKEFYQDLKNSLDKLKELVEKTGLVVKPEGMGRAQRRQVSVEINGYAYLLAKEFIQHLIAEYNYQQQNGETPTNSTPSPPGGNTMSEAFGRAGLA